MSYRAPRNDGIAFWLALGSEIGDRMEQHNLRILGQTLATLVIGALAGADIATGNVAVGGITAIWVVTIPEFIEAWFAVRRNQRRRDREQRGNGSND